VSSPIISVVLPVYNAGLYLQDAICSILKQTCSDFELLVIDDGSTDDSLQIAQNSVGTDPRARIRSRSNKGLVATCNEAISEARGKYIFRMDQDDVSHPERFARQVAFMEADSRCVALGTRVMLADESMMPIIESFKAVTHAEIDAENLRGRGSAMCHPTAAIRRDALLDIGGYRAEFEWAEDLDLFLRLAEVGQLANLPTVLLTYRQHLTSVGYSKRALQRTRAAMAVSDAMRRRAAVVSGGGEKPGVEVRREGTPMLESEYQSVADIHRKWAWLALIGGFPETARKHAWLALTKQPLRGENLRLMACAIRGH